MIESHVPPKASEWPARRVFEWNNYDSSYSARIDVRQEQRYRTGEPVMRVTVRETSRSASASIQVPKNEAIALAISILRAAGVEPSLVTEELVHIAQSEADKPATSFTDSEKHAIGTMRVTREANEARASI